MRPFAIVGTLALPALWACETPTSAARSGDNHEVVRSATAANVVTPPTLVSATFFGGAGDQVGDAITVAPSGIHLAGSDASGPTALLVAYGLPPSVPLWNATLPTSYFSGVALAGSTLFAVGDARPPTCGAYDGIGSTEPKTILARISIAGALLGCGSQNLFPYSGNEDYTDAVASMEGGVPFVYATGGAEQLGFGRSLPFILAKYDASGALVGRVTEPGITLGSYAGCCPGSSYANGLGTHNGSVYVAGWSRLTGFGEDAVERPMLMKYTTGLVRAWKVRPTDNTRAIFLAVTGLADHVYAVGIANASGSPAADYLIEKYDESGNRIWSVTSGGGAEDVLQGVVAIGSRLFAVGYTRSSGAGESDAVILEIDPATGATISTTLFGGAQDDQAWGVATDGTDLYVVGSSRSFASSSGNAVGESDLMLLRYTLAPPVLTVPIDIKPGSQPNSINPASAGVIPVAVLTSAAFNAASVDVATVRFGASGAEAAAKHSAMEDVDGDGDLDLILQFQTRQTGLRCGATSASLTGKTTDGQLIRGSDAVRMTPCP